MSGAPTTSIDPQAFKTAQSNYAAVIPAIRKIAGNLDGTVQGAKSGWQGQAYVAFCKFADDLHAQIIKLNGDLNAVSDALDQGQKVIANTEYDNAESFTSLGTKFT
ncbi:WXG100 family type VII secretion target [Nocardia sp. NPDC046473]|uniref:WXG100 family type VII secretion target n=1 Tax=unclassified Nocardia TaxID=2637762 RepID=UPI0034032D03